jgi:toxin ParE1/3/4
MKASRLRTLSRADRDFDDIVAFYLREAGAAVAGQFITALEAAYGDLAMAPGGGSPALGTRLGMADLRTWRVRGFPYLICYILEDDGLAIWRIVHGQRDLPRTLAGLLD